MNDCNDSSAVGGSEAASVSTRPTDIAMVQTADFGISGWSGTTRAAGGVNLVSPTVPRNLPRASRAPAGGLAFTSGHA